MGRVEAEGLGGGLEAGHATGVGHRRDEGHHVYRHAAIDEAVRRGEGGGRRVANAHAVLADRNRLARLSGDDDGRGRVLRLGRRPAGRVRRGHHGGGEDGDPRARSVVEGGSEYLAARRLGHPTEHQVIVAAGATEVGRDVHAVRAVVRHALEVVQEDQVGLLTAAPPLGERRVVPGLDGGGGQRARPDGDVVKPPGKLEGRVALGVRVRHISIGVAVHADMQVRLVGRQERVGVVWLRARMDQSAVNVHRGGAGEAIPALSVVMPCRHRKVLAGVLNRNFDD
mmetsp:Transcript_34771/g.82958  ORF Transcript_34771/g.82958 Transcript_34771/m.82958 type:complete len:283 (+) Transcript_34771:2475-3323(+)